MTRSFYRRLARRSGERDRLATRREFLAHAGAGLVLLSCQGLPTARRVDGKRIVVIGAGFAGLSCSYELQRAGYDVTLIEASARVGGRVRSSTEFVPGRVIEIGGELIGVNHPTWMAYKDVFHLDLIELSEHAEWEQPVVLDGKRLSRDEARELLAEMDDVFNRSIDADAAGVVADEPWRTPGAEELDARTTEQWIAMLDCSESCKRALALEFMSNNGQQVAKQSYLGNLTQVKGHGGALSYRDESETHRCKGGNQTLAIKLAEQIRNLIRELPVRIIDWSDEQVIVTCADGRKLICDDVVLAVPPSVWSKIEFRPALPTALEPQMGLNTKWFAHMQSRFWRQAGLEQYAMSDGVFNMTWEGTDGQDGDENPVFVCFNGGASAALARELSADAQKQRYLQELDVLYPGFSTNLAGKTFFMDWPSETWAKASYSFPAPGQITTQGPILHEGLSGRLHFAGEHTCYRFVGYMEGALYSGSRLAERLARRDGVTK